MLEPTVLYLIRHAEPDFGPEGRICLGDQIDLPLSEAGRIQAAQLGERMSDIHLDAIYVSPLLRARQTADAFLQDCPRITAAALTEVGSGEWEGLRFSDIYLRYPEYFDLTGSDGGKTPPGGESDEEALNRGMSLLDELKEHAGKTYLLVTHSGIGRILLCHMLGFPMHRKRTIPMKYASCTEVIREDGTWKVKLSEELIGSC